MASGAVADAGAFTPGRDVRVGKFRIGNDRPMTLISGPCQIESRDHSLEIAERLKAISEQAGINFVFKSSFDKANRTSMDGKRGIGFKAGLAVLAEIREQFGCPTLTDVHEVHQCQAAAEAVDILQIPAFLCRQTDLLVAAGESGAAVNIKKGQFLAPWDMKQVAAKVAACGNHRILLCERGSSFGYNSLIADMRSLPIMAALGYPVVIDATHSVQQPGGLGAASGGQREFAPVICRAGVAVGVAAVFMETHDDPDAAPSDGPTMIPIADMPQLIARLVAIDRVVKSPLTHQP
ncbi:MAG: 3-deoxy-8-phosphooctulonate synthase [Rhodobacteraceae bacterium]|nr:3-deoxy-8-phosphooctulonate synthase [Paracoccaceae bacterium]MCY4197459.1 3-deoxy-8-phosphooctulonate synthase [Paracoccaceae bacterium]